MVLLTDSVLKQPHCTASRAAQSTQLHHEGTYLSAEHVGIDRPERRAPLYWYNQSKGGCAFMLQSLPAYKKKKVNWIKQNGKQLSFAIPHDHHSCDIIYDVCVIKTLNGFAKGKEKKGGKTSDHSNNGAAQLWSCSSAISDIAAIAFNLL